LHYLAASGARFEGRKQDVALSDFLIKLKRQLEIYYWRTPGVLVVQVSS
jgi:hypothetical protein